MYRATWWKAVMRVVASRCADLHGRSSIQPGPSLYTVRLQYCAYGGGGQIVAYCKRGVILQPLQEPECVRHSS